MTEHFGSEAAGALRSPRPFGDGGLGLRMDAAAHLDGFLTVQWWAAWSGRPEPGGGGYVAQRIFSARSERDGGWPRSTSRSRHYALRPWPWIVTGLATVILYPDLEDREAATCLPSGPAADALARVHAGGICAAYMSTVATQLNWGASYLVNDFYKRSSSVTPPRMHTWPSRRAATILLFLASILVTSQLSSIEQAWRFLLAHGAGPASC